VTFHFRLNGGFGIGFLLNAFGFSAPSLSSFFYLSLTLPTESRLQSRLFTESFGVATPSPFISLPTKSRLRSRHSTESFGFAAPSPFLSLPSPSPFLSLYLSLLLAFSLSENTVSLSLATECTLNRLSTEFIRLLCWAPFFLPLSSFFYLMFLFL
jgi:hypothetical protein